MPNVILFDNEVRDQLLPFTWLKPMGELRVGILTIREKWERMLGYPVSFLTQEYLSGKYTTTYSEVNILIDGSVMPTPELVGLIRQMTMNEALLLGDELIAAMLSGEQVASMVKDEDFGELRVFPVEEKILLRLSKAYDIFRLNDRALELDFALLTHNRVSAPLSATNRVVGPADRVFLEEGARVECSVLNTERGPVYIGKDSLVMEGCLIRGGFAMGEHSVLKMGAKIYGATTLGPYCKVGGEVNNVVFQGYSNKGHEGYLGNSVIGEWCNIGADTNASNLKNTYDEVRVWNYAEQRFSPSGLQFCGLLMGDHSKCGINTMFNTGTVVGVSANIFGAGFPRQFIPSFSWGGAQGISTFQVEKAMDAINRVMERRNLALSVQERLILLHVFEETAQYRPWDKKKSAS